jgi:putative inorganic carbon (HCO3(-)) transporter
MRKRLDHAATALLRVELPVVMLATLAGMAASSLLPMSVAVMGVMLLIRAWVSLSASGRLQIAHTPADLPLLLLTGTLFVTLWATPRMDVTLPQVLRLLMGMGLFLALTNNAHLIAKRASLVAAGVALLGVMLVFSMPFTVEWSGASKFAFLPPALYRGFTLVVSDGVNPNVMAGAIVLLLPVAFAQLFKSSPARSVFFALVVLILFAGLMLAGSRSALFAAVSTGFVLLIIQLPRKFAGVLVVLAGLAAVLVVASSRLFETQIGAAVNGLLTSNDALSGSLSRMEIWSRAIYIIQDFPFTGIGMGLFAPVTDLLYPMIITRPGIEHAHNLILQIAVDLGLPGLVAWLALYFVVMACLLTQMRRKSFMDKSWVVGLFGAQVALILGGITDAVTWGMVRSAPLVWGLWGLAVASWLSSSQHDNTMD